MSYQAMPVAAPVTTTAIVVNPGQWGSGICDCFSDFGSCLDNYFCSWCANARQWDAVDGRPDSMNLIIFLANCCLGTQYILNCVVRCNVVSKFNLDESSCMSCCLAFWLGPCVMCQNHRELSSRGFYPGGFCCDPPAGFQAPNVAVMGAGYQQQPQQGGYQQGGYQQQPVYQQQPQQYGQQPQGAYATAY